ncbi:hypothetical protein TDB9533_00646 [Thalassocella blandensis]|nr:hypothetical protein TDB9533_00646 [Thalassocella blandensis]
MEELFIRNAKIQDIEDCIDIRGRTRENAIDRVTLKKSGVTLESWRAAIASGDIIGSICESIDDHRQANDHLSKRKEIVGFCFADPANSEILVLAVLPQYENKSIGKLLLGIITERLRSRGCQRLWLAVSPEAKHRAHGFYRHLGWKPTGNHDKHRDEILVCELSS